MSTYSLKILRGVVLLSAILAFMVVMLGAYTRLTHAGLGCPDWPGCYGRLMVTSLHEVQLKGAPIEMHKAWTEMVHRYLAGCLVLLVLFINLAVYFLNRQSRFYDGHVPLILLLLILFQACLGMWTVTLKLLPLVVMGHLLGGILVFSLLCYFLVSLSPVRQVSHPGLRSFVSFGIVLVLLQLSLGGWVSSNYAGMACVGFPKCSGQWLPKLDFLHGFHLLLPVGANYQGGVLDAVARTTIQFIHRLGALTVGLYLCSLSIYLIAKVPYRAIRVVAALCMTVVLVQFVLGILNVIYLLPLPIAVLHNGVAALLLAICFVLFYLVSGREACNESAF